MGRLWAVLIANLAWTARSSPSGSPPTRSRCRPRASTTWPAPRPSGAMGLEGRPATARRPGGYPRATRHAAALNHGWLLVLGVAVAAGAVDPFATGVRRVHGVSVLVMSEVAAPVTLAGAPLLDGDLVDDEAEGQSNLSMPAVPLDAADDAAPAADVAVPGGLIYATGTSWLDPVTTLAVAVVVGYHAARIVARIRLALPR